MPELSQLAGLFLKPLSNGVTPLRVISLSVLPHPEKKWPLLQLPILCPNSEFQVSSALQCRPGPVVAAALCDAPTPTALGWVLRLHPLQMISLAEESLNQQETNRLPLASGTAASL